jgi:hypothetical protein
MAGSSRGDPQGKIRRRVPTHQGKAIEEASGLLRHMGLIHGVEPHSLGGLAACPFGDFILRVQADAYVKIVADAAPRLRVLHTPVRHTCVSSRYSLRR